MAKRNGSLATALKEVEAPEGNVNDPNLAPEGYVKCPRCYQHSVVGNYNFDNLCDRCCKVIVERFPDHWSVPGIKAAFAEQRANLDNEEYWRKKQPEKVNG